MTSQTFVRKDRILEVACVDLQVFVLQLTPPLMGSHRKCPIQDRYVTRADGKGHAFIRQVSDTGLAFPSRLSNYLVKPECLRCNAKTPWPLKKPWKPVCACLTCANCAYPQVRFSRRHSPTWKSVSSAMSTKIILKRTVSSPVLYVLSVPN